MESDLEATGLASRDIKALGMAWVDALCKQDLEGMVSLYVEKATLFATFFPVARGTAEIRNYFKVLLEHEGLRVEMQESEVHHLDSGHAVLSGLYIFTFHRDGKMLKLPARFTYLFGQVDGKWLILHHHSSEKPAG